MNAATWRINVGRVVLTGAAPANLDVSQIRDLVGQALASGLAEASLPRGRTARAAVQVDAGPLGSGEPAVAHAIGSAVVAAIGGAGGHG
jgi:hypothetical protein